MKICRTQLLRLLIQIFALIPTFYVLYRLIIGTFQIVHSWCPYSVICFGIYNFTFKSAIALAMSFAILIGLVIATMTIFWGRKFCGYLCPLGTYQEALYQLRSRKYRCSKRVPFFLERKLAGLKYLVLVFNVAFVVTGISYIYMRFCPVVAFSTAVRMIPGSIVILALITVCGLLTERMWCRWLCPYAALMNVFQWLSELFKIKRFKLIRNLESCVDCGICMQYCPMNINLQESDVIENLNCIHCMMCAAKCPKPGTFTTVNHRKED